MHVKIHYPLEGNIRTEPTRYSGKVDLPSFLIMSNILTYLPALVFHLLSEVSHPRWLPIPVALVIIQLKFHLFKRHGWSPLTSVFSYSSCFPSLAYSFSKIGLIFFIGISHIELVACPYIFVDKYLLVFASLCRLCRCWPDQSN